MVVAQAFVNDEDKSKAPEYDFQRLHDITKVVTRNLNRVIDVNYYPIPEARCVCLSPKPFCLLLSLSLSLSLSLYCVPFSIPCPFAHLVPSIIVHSILFQSIGFGFGLRLEGTPTCATAPSASESRDSRMRLSG